MNISLEGDRCYGKNNKNSGRVLNNEEGVTGVEIACHIKQNIRVASLRRGGIKNNVEESGELIWEMYSEQGEQPIQRS